MAEGSSLQAISGETSQSVALRMCNNAPKVTGGGWAGEGAAATGRTECLRILSSAGLHGCLTSRTPASDNPIDLGLVAQRATSRFGRGGRVSAGRSEQRTAWDRLQRLAADPGRYREGCREVASGRHDVPRRGAPPSSWRSRIGSGPWPTLGRCRRRPWRSWRARSAQTGPGWPRPTTSGALSLAAAWPEPAQPSPGCASRALRP